MYRCLCIFNVLMISHDNSRNTYVQVWVWIFFAICWYDNILYICLNLWLPSKINYRTSRIFCIFLRYLYFSITICTVATKGIILLYYFTLLILNNMLNNIYKFYYFNILILIVSIVSPYSVMQLYYTTADMSIV